MYNALRTSTSFYSSTQLNIDWKPPSFEEDHPTIALGEAEDFRQKHHKPWLVEATMFVGVMRKRVNSIKALLQSYHDMMSKRIQCNRAYAESLIDASNTVDVDTFPMLVAQHKHFGSLMTDANRQEAVNIRDLCAKVEHLIAHDTIFVDFQPHVTVFGDEVISKAELQLNTAKKLHNELNAIYKRRPSSLPYEQNSYRWEMTYRQYWSAYVSALALGDIEEAQHRVEVFECKGWAHISRFITEVTHLITGEGSEDMDSLQPGPWKTLLEKLRLMDPMSSQLSVVSTASSPTNPPLPAAQFPIIAGSPPVLLQHDVKCLVQSPFQSAEWQNGVLVLTLAHEIMYLDFARREPVASAMLGNAHIRIDLSKKMLYVDENPNSAWWSKSVTAALSSLSTGLPGLALPAENFVAQLASQEEFEQWRCMITDFQAQARLDIGHGAQGRVSYSDSGRSRASDSGPSRASVPNDSSYAAHAMPDTTQVLRPDRTWNADRKTQNIEQDKVTEKVVRNPSVKVHSSEIEKTAPERSPLPPESDYGQVTMEPWYDLNLEDDGSFSESKDEATLAPSHCPEPGERHLKPGLYFRPMEVEPALHPLEAIESGLHPSEAVEPRLHPGGTSNPRLYPCETSNPDLHPSEAVEPRLHPCETSNPELHACETSNPGLHACGSSSPRLYPCETSNPGLHPCGTSNPRLYPCETSNPELHACETPDPGMYPCEPADSLSNTNSSSPSPRVADDITECPFSFDRADDFHARHDTPMNGYVPLALRGDEDSGSQEFKSDDDLYDLAQSPESKVEAYDPELIE